MSQTEIRLAEEALRFSTGLALRRSISGSSGEIPLRRKDGPVVNVQAALPSPALHGGNDVFVPALSRRPVPGGWR